MRRLLSLLVGINTVVALVGCGGGDDDAATTTAAGRTADARWVITDLGTLGGNASEAVAINDRGQVIGMADTTDDHWHPFLWQNGKMRDLGTLGTEGTWVYDINDRGQVIGDGHTRGGDEHAFLWEAGQMRDLGTLGGVEKSHASDINNRGQTVGEADTNKSDRYADPYAHAFLWQSGKMQDLGPRGSPESEAVAINDRGQVVGWSATKTRGTYPFLWQEGVMRVMSARGEATAINDRGQIVGYSLVSGHAFVWQGGKALDLGTLGGNSSWPIAINERGQVTGDSRIGRDDADGQPIEHAFLWQKGKIRDLGTLGGVESKASAVNEQGHVVGSAAIKAWYWDDEDRMWISHAFLWQSGKMTDLGTLGGRASMALAINERGQIVGWSETKTGDTHAVLWTPKR